MAENTVDRAAGGCAGRRRLNSEGRKFFDLKGRRLTKRCAYRPRHMTPDNQKVFFHDVFKQKVVAVAKAKDRVKGAEDKVELTKELIEAFKKGQKDVKNRMDNMLPDLVRSLESQLKNVRVGEDRNTVVDETLKDMDPKTDQLNGEQGRQLEKRKQDNDNEIQRQNDILDREEARNNKRIEMAKQGNFGDFGEIKGSYVPGADRMTDLRNSIADQREALDRPRTMYAPGQNRPEVMAARRRNREEDQLQIDKEQRELDNMNRIIDEATDLNEKIQLARDGDKNAMAELLVADKKGDFIKQEKIDTIATRRGDDRAAQLSYPRGTAQYNTLAADLEFGLTDLREEQSKKSANERFNVELDKISELELKRSSKNNEMENIKEILRSDTTLNAGERLDLESQRDRLNTQILDLDDDISDSKKDRNDMRIQRNDEANARQRQVKDEVRNQLDFQDNVEDTNKRLGNLQGLQQQWETVLDKVKAKMDGMKARG